MAVVRWWRWGRDESGYGAEKYHFDGESLPSLMRQVCASKPDGCKQQRPVVKWAKHDSARLRAKECVRRYLRRVG